MGRRISSFPATHLIVHAFRAPHITSQLPMLSTPPLNLLEFWKGNTEYDFEIDAATGRIRDYDIERHAYNYDYDDYDFDDMFD